jgi:ferredoxin-NADP reductase
MIKIKFESKEEIQDGVFTFHFSAGPKVQWQPGQYMHYFLKHPDADDRGEDRYFTISSAPYEGKIMLTTRWSGDKASSFKKAMFALKAGDELEAEEPSGKFVWREGDLKRVLVSGGIGITPFRSMLAQLDHDDQEIDADLLYANRDEHFVFDDELRGISARHPGLRIKKFTGKEITIDDLTPFSSSKTLYYLSGPEPMVNSFKEQLLSAGISEENVLKDSFPGYSSMTNA